ncbi:hypothetical protein GCM10025783_30410 [Amnibacterium soli]|uniref:Immunity protein Imm33 domain-containing protein n=1 Tax=Amnibacterium soli TaxID=1282736 RepID=A0ABP8ZFN8_9MICO
MFGRGPRSVRPWYVLGLPDPATMRPLAPDVACFVTNRISAEGAAVGYMVRMPVEPGDRKGNSGWQFMAGDEDQAYIDDPDNSHIFSVNTIANHDPAVIPFLDRARGTAWGRKGNTFVEEPLPWSEDEGPA